MKRRGFTLTEVVVVIAVIVVLAALLFPVFKMVREKSRQTVCSSNLRQIGLLLQQYTTDNDGFYPGTRYFYGTGRRAGLFLDIKNPQLLWCPSSRLAPYPGMDGFAICASCPGSTSTFPYPMTTNYQYNPRLINDAARRINGFLTDGWGKHEAALINVSNFFVAHDRQDPSDGIPGVIIPDYPTLHSGGGNYLFGDGHVKWMDNDGAETVQATAVAQLPPP